MMEHCEANLSDLGQQLRHSSQCSGGFEVVSALKHQLNHFWIAGADSLLEH